MIGSAILDMDGTILAKRSIDFFCESFGLEDELKRIDKLSIELPAYKITEKIAELLAGKRKQDLLNIFKTMPLSPGVEDFIDFLRKKNFYISIATDSYQFLADYLAKKLKIDSTYGNILQFKNNIITGKVLTQPRCLKISGCKEFSVCKLWFLRELKSKIGGINVSIGDGDSDICAFTEADISIAYRPRSDKLRRIAHFEVFNFYEVIRVIDKELRNRNLI